MALDLEHLTLLDRAVRGDVGAISAQVDVCAHCQRLCRPFCPTSDLNGSTWTTVRGSEGSGAMVLSQSGCGGCVDLVECITASVGCGVQRVLGTVWEDLAPLTSYRLITGVGVGTSALHPRDATASIRLGGQDTDRGTRTGPDGLAPPCPHRRSRRGRGSAAHADDERMGVRACAVAVPHTQPKHRPVPRRPAPSPCQRCHRLN